MSITIVDTAEWREMREDESIPLHVKERLEDDHRRRFSKLILGLQSQLPCFGQVRFQDKFFAGEICEVHFDSYFLVRLLDYERPYQRSVPVEHLPEELIHIMVEPGRHLERR